MKKNLTIGLFAFISMFMMSGCIDFLEDITFHKDGSGSYKFTMDMSALKSMMDSFDGFGDQEDKEEKEKKTNSNPAGDMTSDMTEKFDDLKGKVETIEGISHFVSINDTKNYVFGFQFDFKNLTALDKALHEQDDKLSESTILFSGTKRLFTRSNKGSLAESFKDEFAGVEGSDEDLEMVKSMFGDMKLRTVYHFDRRVKSSTNPNSLISADSKTVTLDYYFFKPEMNKGDLGMATTIKLKRR